MDDFALIMNAGSSSVKFFVLRRTPGEWWRIECRGQIEGIGTAPRLSAKNGDAQVLTDQKLEPGVNDGRKAIDVLAGWLRSEYGGSRVLAVGHRVVHGGPNFAHPVVVTPEVLTELRRLIPLAPLHQPHNVAAIEAFSERLRGILR